MNFNHLRAFYSVATNKSFTLACEELNVSQSTVSLQVQELEKHYNLTLLKRKKRPIELTDEGKIIFSYAKKIFHLVQEMEIFLHDLNTLHVATVKIGSTPLLASYILPNFIWSLRKGNPRMKFQLYPGGSRQVLEKIISYEYHVGFIVRVPYPDHIIFKEISKQKLYFITRDEFKNRIHLEDLKNYPIILRKTGSATRDYITNEFRNKNIPLNNYVEADPSSIKSMVQLGMGGAFFPFYAIAEETEEKRFRCIEILDDLHVYIDAIYLAERRKTQTVKSVVSALNGHTFAF
ncbi:MAG: LysR family transcriptional regulator [Candidatus Hodarchaeota archaeon]